MKRILVIDDSQIVLDVMRLAFEDEGFSVLACEEPTREQLTGSAAPDLILLDINMRLAFGDDVALFFREAWGVSAPIYLFSDIPEDELAETAARVGVNGYMWKGWGLARVVDEVKSLLEDNGAAGARRRG